MHQIKCNIFNSVSIRVKRVSDMPVCNLWFKVRAALNVSDSASSAKSDDYEYAFILDTGACKSKLSAQQDLYDILEPYAKDYGISGVSADGNIFPILDVILPRILIGNNIVIRYLQIGLTPTPVTNFNISGKGDASLNNDSETNKNLPEIDSATTYCLLGTDILRLFKNSIASDFKEWTISLNKFTLLSGYFLSNDIVNPASLGYTIPEYMRDEAFFQMLLDKYKDQLNTSIYSEVLDQCEALIASVYDIFNNEYPNWKTDEYPENPFGYKDFIQGSLNPNEYNSERVQGFK